MEESRRVLAFGAFELDEARAELRKDGGAVELQLKPFNLLCYLVRNRDRVVPKRELLDRIWPGVIVSDAALSSALRDLRRALEDDGAAQRLIRTQRGRGYRFVAEVTEASAPEPIPEPRRIVDDVPGPPRPSTFIGRDDERAWLRRLMRKALEGEPRVALIGGEAGVGKTWLVREFATVERQSGVEVAIGRCHEQLALPYRPIAEALARRIGRLGGGARSLLGEHADLVGRILSFDAAAPALEPAWPDGERHRSALFLALSEAVIRLSQTRPTLLVLEDIHWADAATLELLAALVVALSDAGVGGRVPLLLALTYRSGEAAGALEQTLDRLRREPISEAIELAGLDDVQTRELLVQLGVSRPASPLLRAVSEATRGNPLFIREVAQQLQGRADAPTAAELRLPGDVAAAIGARVERLSEPCRESLTFAAFAGEQFDPALVAAGSDLAEPTVAARLAEAEAAGLVTRYGDTFEFDHPTVRQALLGRGEAERSAIHGRIAAALEKLRAPDGDAHAMEIAHHLIGARPAVDPDRLVHYASRAGDQAFGICAWGDAARYHAAAAATADAAGLLSESDRARLHFQSSLAYSYDGDGRLSVEACERALEGYRRAGDPEGLAWALMYRTRARFSVAAAAYGEELDPAPLFQVAEELAERDPGLHGLVLETIAEVYWVARRPAEAIELAQRALALGHEHDDDRLRQHATMGLGLAYMQDLRIREALDAWRECSRYARRTEERRTPPGQRIALALQHLGRIDEAEQVAREAVADARRTHNRGELALALASQAGIAVVRGEFAAAERAAHSAMTEVMRSRYPWGGALALTSVACARAQQGAFAEAGHALDLLVEPGHLFGDPGPHIQLAAAVYRELIQARATRDWTLDRERAANLVRLLRAGGNDPLALGPICAMVEIASLARAADLVAYPEQQLALAAEREVVLTTGWAFLVPRVRALAFALGGRRDEAERGLDAAISLATRSGMRTELARAHLDAARLLGTRDDQRAAAHLRRARRIIAEHRMDGLAAEAAALAGRIGAVDRPLTARDSTIVLAADLVGDTDGDHRALLRACVDGHRGRERLSSDASIIASFDHVGAALECAVELQYAAARAQPPLQARVGLAVGERREDAVPSAAEVELARRIRNRASPAQILAAETIRRLATGARFAFVSAAPLAPAADEDPVPLAQLDWESDRV